MDTERQNSLPYVKGGIVMATPRHLNGTKPLLPHTATRHRPAAMLNMLILTPRKRPFHRSGTERNEEMLQRDGEKGILFWGHCDARDGNESREAVTMRQCPCWGKKIRNEDNQELGAMVKDLGKTSPGPSSRCPLRSRRPCRRCPCHSLEL